ncbi:MAG TPA: hypothetical protein VG797_07960 [Phycisphaerales bacterium]|nr:hypothetical protein [Phycisphaerales bacterium]
MKIDALDGLAKAHRKELVRAFKRRRRGLVLVWFVAFVGTMMFLVFISSGVGRTNHSSASQRLEDYIVGGVLVGFVLVAAISAEVVYRVFVKDGIAACIEKCQCIACGYSLKGLPRGDRLVKCPECGKETPVAEALEEGGAG